MDRGSKVIELHKNRGEEPGGVSALQDEIADQFAQSFEDGDLDEAQTGRWRKPLALALCGGGGLLWLGLLAADRWAALGGRSPALADFVSFVVAAAPPLALLGVIWLVLLRSSRAESDRFEATRAAMEAEGRRLQALLAFVQTRVDASRQSLSDQGNALMSLGEETSGRLAGSAQAIGAEIERISSFAQTLQGTAGATRGDLAVLLSHLPKAQVQMRNIATALSEASTAAQAGTRALSGEILALGLKSNEARGLAQDAVAQLTQHFATMTETAGQLRTLIANGHEGLASAGEEGSAALMARVESVTAEIAKMGAMLAEHDTRGLAMVDRMGSSIGDMDARFAELETQANARAERLGLALGALRNHADDLKTALEGGSDAATGLSEKTESLLTALDAAAREIDETIPAAYRKLEGEAARALDVARAAEPVVTAMAQASEAMAGRISDADAVLAQQQAQIDAMAAKADEQLAACQQQAEALLALMRDTNMEADALSRSAGTDLLDVLGRTREVAQQAAQHSREAIAGLVPAAAEELGEASRKALTDAMTGEIDAQMTSVNAAIERSVVAAQETVAQLERQVQAIGRTSAALEARIEASQDESDRRDHTHFARRVALLIESLNSTAIDVTKVLSNDVTDMAWASYMRGDRGVFARRAVKLLDNSDAREIARHYQDDPEFRDQVNRYIHDYEAMLRNVMATREGTPLSVALLSSDTGKLYVALAQAIERLRV